MEGKHVAMFTIFCRSQAPHPSGRSRLSPLEKQTGMATRGRQLNQACSKRYRTINHAQHVVSLGQLRSKLTSVYFTA